MLQVPYSGTIDTTTLPNGTATLMAVATDNENETYFLTASYSRSLDAGETLSEPGGRRRTVRWYIWELLELVREATAPRGLGVRG